MNDVDMNDVQREFIDNKFGVIGLIEVLLQLLEINVSQAAEIGLG